MPNGNIERDRLIVRMVEIADRDDTTGLATDALREGAEELAAAYHDIDRYMKIANEECNRAEAAQAALDSMGHEGLADLPRLIELQRTAAPDCDADIWWNKGLCCAAEMVRAALAKSLPECNILDDTREVCPRHGHSHTEVRS